MRLIDADELIKNIPNEEMISKYAVAHAPTIDKFEIAKQALIEAIDNAETVGDVVENIIGRPQEWVPCSERLPKIGQKVLASTKKTVFTQVFKGYHSDPTRWAWENNSIKRIEAWQPLPKPWKGADDEV